MTMRRTTCPQCRKKLGDGERIHPGCRDAYADAVAAKSERKAAKAIKTAAKEDRAETKRRKEAMKPRAKWLKECQALANKYARLRDLIKGHGCISCGASPSERFGGAVDGGHFRSTGSAPHLRLDLRNIRLQCVKCNRFLGSNTVEYRKNLVIRIGLPAVEALESDQEPRKFTIEYLIRYKSVFRKKVRRLEKRMLEPE